MNGRLRSRGLTGMVAVACVVVVAGCSGSRAAASGGISASAGTAAASAAGASGGISASAGSAGASAAGWTETAVEQPVAPGSSGPGPSVVFCSPCHAVVEASLAAVTAAGSTFVAVGIEFPPPRAAAWFSTDGTAWHRAAGLEAPDGSLMAAVAAGPRGVVAVGGVGPAAAAWTSSDGRTWRQGTVQAPAISGTVRMDAVVSGPAGLVAAGGASVGSTQVRALAWTSSDGTHWTTTADAPSFAGGTIAGLSASRSRIVAVGSAVASDGTLSGAAWWSEDGRTWSPGSVEPSFAGAQLLAVTAGGPGFVAVGTAGGGVRAAAWWSADGIHWTPAPGGPGFTNLGQRISMTAVTAGGPGFVAAGSRDSAGNGSGAAWVSRDGMAWQRVPDPVSFGGAELAGVASGTSGVVAVGAIGLPDNWTAAAWLSRSPGS